jgi:phage terminase Nu1 subunit (DNA packaging protein)
MSERPKADNPTVEVGVLAKLFNLTAVRVQQLATDGIVIKHARGRYDLWPSIRNYIKYLQERKVNQWSGSGEGAGDYEGHRARLTKAKADMAEMDAELKKGTVHAAEAVAAVWADMISNARAKLLALPTKLAGALDGLTITERQEVLKLAMNEALQELASYRPEVVTGEWEKKRRSDDDAEDDADA